MLTSGLRYLTWFSIFGLLAWGSMLGCSSDDEESTPGSGGSGGSQSDASGGSAGSGGSGGSAGSGGGAGAGGSAGADAGCTQGDITLKNDGFVDMGQVAFQGGFDNGECWAVTYRPDSCDYDIQSLLLLVGGGDAGTVDYDISVWDVDAAGKPTAQVGNAQSFTVSGAMDVMSEIPLTSLFVPTRSGTPFAVSVCQTMDGPPSAGRDTDGITPDSNWIFAGGQWAEASTLGVAGDWIMRVKIRQ